MKKKNASKFFTMVEVAIAVAVLALGATSVVTLVPTAIEQKNSSVGDNYSALFISDTQSYFSAQANKNFEQLKNDLPTYSALFSDTSANITTAKRGDLVFGDIYKTDKPGVYEILKTTSGSSGTHEDFIAQVVIWQSNPYASAVSSSEETETSQTKENPFEINQGIVISDKAAKVSMKCLGSEWKDQTGRAYPVYFEIDITEPGKAKETIYPYGKNVAANSSSPVWSLPDEKPAGTKIVAKAYDPYYRNWFNSSTSLSNVKTLKNDDPVPTDAPFYENQSSAADLIKDYISEDGKTIVLEDNQVIYLFELNTKPPYDYQDLVVLANIAPEEGAIISSDDIGISPTNNDYAFEISDNTGVVFDRDDMKKVTQGKDKDKSFSQDFEINSLKMRVKSGDIASLIIDGEEVPIDGKDIVLNSVDLNALKVRVYSKNPGMGQWYIKVLSSRAVSNFGMPAETVVVSEETTSTTTEETNTPQTNAIGVNVEISWPVTQPDYSKRKKVRFYTEYYNMNQIGS